MSLIAAQVAPTLDDLKAASITDETIVFRQRLYRWFATSDDPADDDEVVASDDTGFWISQMASDLPASDGNTVQDNLDSFRSPTGAAEIGVDFGTEVPKAQDAFNILKATRRPAMDGIFSSNTDQREALIDFIARSAADGQTIEWGPIEVSLDPSVVDPNSGRRGLLIPGGSRWVMHPNTRIRALPNASTAYEILNLHDASDIFIEGGGATIVGERDAHTGTTGEWGQGLSIRGCTDVTVRDLSIRDCWGDGIYVGAGTQPYNERILLQSLHVDRARRNGLSLITAKDFSCIDCSFTNSGGTAPEKGVDIEPNDKAEFLQRILFDRTYTAGNEGAGIGVYLNSLNGTANPVDIRIVNHRDDGSAGGFQNSVDPDVPGVVQVIDSLYVNSQNNAINFRNKKVSGPHCTIIRPTCIDWNRSGSSSTIYSTGISMYNSDEGASDPDTVAMGNVDILEPRLVLNSGHASKAIGIFEERSNTHDLPQSFRIIDPRDLSGLSIAGSDLAPSLITDKYRASLRTLSGTLTETIGGSSTWVTLVVPDLADHRYKDLSARSPVGLEITFEMMSTTGKQLRIRFPGQVLLNRNVANYYHTTTRGAILTIRKVSTTEWMIVHETAGDWVEA